MKVLLDSCIGARIRKALQEAGHDVAWVAELGPDPGDAFVLARAFTENRVLVTMDADYGVLAIVEQKPHAGIIRLLVDLPAHQSAVVLHVLEHYGAELSEGALLTADLERVRLRKG